jgi:predicted nucleic acid-binding protein
MYLIPMSASTLLRKSLELTLVTNNEKEFRRVSGLNVENWAK